MTINHIDRIYIGGLEPTRLTVEEVLNRLTDQLPESLRIESLHYSKEKLAASYMQFTVVSISTPDSDLKRSYSSQGENEPSFAFQLIHKLFNNVKWKGCRLKVEYAKPHFLERLHAEIRNRLTTTSKSPNNYEATQTLPDYQNVIVYTNAGRCDDTKLSRYLKVKKVYGQTYWKVDTKPYLVADWNGFQKVRKYTNRKRELYRQKIMDHTNGQKSELNKQNYEIKDGQNQEAYVSRSIHLRFGSDEKMLSPDMENSRLVSPGVSGGKHKFALADEGDYIEVKKDNELRATSKNVTDSRRKDAYSWSDKDNSIDSKKEPLMDTKTMKDSYSDKIDNQKEGYAWSDDDSSYSIDNLSHNVSPSPLHSELKKIKELGTQKVDQELDVDLSSEVAVNLSILSQLFSYTGNPTDSLRSLSVQGNEKDTTGEKRVNQPGQNVARMFRYDPKHRTISSESFLETIHQDDDYGDDRESDYPGTCDGRRRNEKISQDSEGEMIVDNYRQSDESKPGPSVNDYMEQPNLRKDPLNNVYEQKKLEDVFRISYDPPSFNFNFSIGAGNIGGSGSDKGDLNEVQITTESLKSDLSRSLSNVPTLSFVNDQISRDSVTRRKRRFAFDFLNEDSALLDYYVHFSYYSSLGEDESKKIMHDLESYRNENATDETWNDDRKYLTNDWKGKQKSAYSRKQLKQRHA